MKLFHLLGCSLKFNTGIASGRTTAGQADMYRWAKSLSQLAGESHIKF